MLSAQNLNTLEEKNLGFLLQVRKKNYFQRKLNLFFTYIFECHIFICSKNAYGQ